MHTSGSAAAACGMFVRWYLFLDTPAQSHAVWGFGTSLVFRKAVSTDVRSRLIQLCAYLIVHVPPGLIECARRSVCSCTGNTHCITRWWWCVCLSSFTAIALSLSHSLYSHTHTHLHSLSLSLSHSLSLSLTLSHSHSLTLTLTLTLARHGAAMPLLSCASIQQHALLFSPYNPPSPQSTE